MTDQTTSIEVISNRRGDMEAHIEGCADIKRTSTDRNSGAVGVRGDIYTGSDVVEAIKAADADMAAWFCREAYDGKGDEIGEYCWTIRGISHAPCFKKVVKAAGVTFGAHDEPSA